MEKMNISGKTGHGTTEQNVAQNKSKSFSEKIIAVFQNLYFDKDDKERRGGSILFILSIFLIGFIVIVIYAIGIGWQDFISTIGIAFSIALASAMVGAFLGFIFGIPRTNDKKDRDDSNEQNNNDSNRSSGKTVQPFFEHNKNLEEISDWITKIIVGVSLIELKTIQVYIVKIANKLAEGLGSHQSSFVFSISVLAFFFVGGFFLGFLWSRIFLPKIFLSSYIEGLQEQTWTLEDKVKVQDEKIEEQKSLEEKKAIIRNKVFELSANAKPENLKDFNPYDFDQEHLQDIIDKVISTFNITEASKLYGKLIIALYDLAKSNIMYYNRINELTDLYKGTKGLVSVTTWTDVALANLNLYDLSPTKENSEYKDRMKEALSEIRRNPGYSDYGVAYAIELYYNLIDQEIGVDKNDKSITQMAENNIKQILEEIMNQRELASWEIFSYFDKNKHEKWMERHKKLEELFPDLFKEIKTKSENYKKNSVQKYKS